MNRTTPSSRRIQHIFSSDDREADSSARRVSLVDDTVDL